MLAVGRLLYLGQAQSAQEGTYVCECSSTAGTSSRAQQLEVLGKPCQGGEACTDEGKSCRLGGGSSEASSPGSQLPTCAHETAGPCVPPGSSRRKRALMWLDMSVHKAPREPMLMTGILLERRLGGRSTC